MREQQVVATGKGKMVALSNEQRGIVGMEISLRTQTHTPGVV